MKGFISTPGQLVLAVIAILLLGFVGAKLIGILAPETTNLPAGAKQNMNELLKKIDALPLGGEPIQHTFGLPEDYRLIFYEKDKNEKNEKSESCIKKMPGKCSTRPCLCVWSETFGVLDGEGKGDCEILRGISSLNVKVGEKEDSCTVIDPEAYLSLTLTKNKVGDKVQLSVS